MNIFRDHFEFGKPIDFSFGVPRTDEMMEELAEPLYKVLAHQVGKVRIRVSSLNRTKREVLLQWEDVVEKGISERIIDISNECLRDFGSHSKEIYLGEKEVLKLYEEMKSVGRLPPIEPRTFESFKGAVARGELNIYAAGGNICVVAVSKYSHLAMGRPPSRASCVPFGSP